jgi:hypothetical protein
MLFQRLGRERVACILGRSLDLEIPHTHLDQLEGTGGVAVMAVPGVGWHTISEAVLMRTDCRPSCERAPTPLAERSCPGRHGRRPDGETPG